MKILVTGGAGYIGSHTLVELLNTGYEPVVVDNFSNSREESLKRVKKITGKDFKFFKVDLLDKKALEKVIKNNNINSVIHFAGLKAVGESSKIPVSYYSNNVTGTLNLLECMKEANIKNIIFSSSATVYGDPVKVPIDETFTLHPTNPYGRTKYFIEEILKDLYQSDKTFNVILLRYFNPIGAHPTGLIGEDPLGIPNNLFPFIAQVAVGKLKELKIFGNDYSTKDGTGVRDYIHVVDLAKGHVKSLEKIKYNPGLEIYNLGTGHGYSVFEGIKAYEKASGKKIPYTLADRRPGDIAECFADPKKANTELGWKAELNLDEMCKDSWNWQSKNPTGYN